MGDETPAREPRRDPMETVPEQAPGGRQRDGEQVPQTLREAEGIEGASEDFAPRTTTDAAQHAPGPHGQGDEPTAAPSGRHGYEDDAAPEVRTQQRRER